MNNTLNRDCIVIKIPEKFLQERSYLINTVFKEFLGLTYIIVKNSKPEYEIILPNKNSIIIEDHFFSSFKDGLDYLDRKNIPERISYSINPFTLEKDIPVIFGLPEIVVHNNNPQNTIHCKIDIFSDIFFMITRWEEYVTTEKDEYGRFPEKSSLSIKNRIHRRPVVNEYIEMLWKMLLFLGYSGTRKNLVFEAILTHDVDYIIRFKNIFRLLRIIAGDLIIRKKPFLIPDSITEYINYKSGKIKDSFDTYDFLMDMSEKINVKSHFYFLAQKYEFIPAKKNSNFDFRYDINDPRTVSIIRNILNRGHHVGIHGSYFSYNNIELFSYELDNLKRITTTVEESRQHYLQFLPPGTWVNECKKQVKVDSTLGFAEDIGFRCGTCHPYQVFDFLGRKPIELKELPLIVMEGSVLHLTKDPEEFYSYICAIIDTVKKYEGHFVFLWHSNTFNTYEWKPYQQYYSKIVNYLGSKCK